MSKYYDKRPYHSDKKCREEDCGAWALYGYPFCVKHKRRWYKYKDITVVHKPYDYRPPDIGLTEYLYG